MKWCRTQSSYMYMYMYSTCTCIPESGGCNEKAGTEYECPTATHIQSNRPYSHKLLTINNYVNCPSNFAFARSIWLFHPPIFEKILMRIRSIDIYILLPAIAPFHSLRGMPSSQDICKKPNHGTDDSESCRATEPYGLW